MKRARKMLRLLILFSLVSFFADMTYESARSIAGPYLSILGANALTIGVVAGFGELVGYSLRWVFGLLADRTKRYWTLMFVGYAINLLTVPMLAYANSWQLAAGLFMSERLGRAIRMPIRDAMLSDVGSQLGRMGWAFGLHEAFDRIGAMLGPILVAVLMYRGHTYQESFAWLVIPAVMALSLLVVTCFFFPNHEILVEHRKPKINFDHNQILITYIVGAALVAVGFADFSLIAYHSEKLKLLPQIWIPIAYALAMGVQGIASLILGEWYDRRGFSVLLWLTLGCSIFAPIVFLTQQYWILLGILLWSIGVGAHESLMRAVIGNMVAAERRGSMYGQFNLIYGTSWFIGSVILGFLYDYSLNMVVAFSMVSQFLALPFFYWVRQKLC